MALINEEDDQQLSTTQSTSEEQKQPGGTTELRQDHNDVAPTDDNPNHIENPDDLHEIQVDDDLNEPDTEELQPGKKDDIDKNLPGDLGEGTP
jgi:hypothetical protein